MTYRVYIKEDYKNKVERIDVKKESSPFIKPVLFGFSILVIAAAFIFGTGSSDSEQKTPDSIPTVAATPDKTITTPASSSISSVQIPGLVDEAILVEGTETVTENLTHNKKIDVAENNNTETVYLENEAELITPEE
ncbi:MAG: hypothetical protein ACPHLK_10200, partial [Gammaproteobacteria bacterium]